MVRKRKEQERGRRDADRNGRGARKDDGGPNYRRKKNERNRRERGVRYLASKASLCLGCIFSIAIMRIRIRRNIRNL